MIGIEQQNAQISMSVSIRRSNSPVSMIPNASSMRDVSLNDLVQDLLYTLTCLGRNQKHLVSHNGKGIL